MRAEICFTAWLILFDKSNSSDYSYYTLNYKLLSCGVEREARGDTASNVAGEVAAAVARLQRIFMG